MLKENAGSVPTIYFHHDEKDMQYALRQPFVSIGSDGSAISETGGDGHPHPRYFGTFPRVLGRYVREEKVLALEDAIRKMTSANAVKIGQYDRGLLRPGLWADVTVFDPVQIIDNAIWEKPRQYATGVQFVVVNGMLVLDQGKHLGTRPGVVLYGKGYKAGTEKTVAEHRPALSERQAAEWVLRAGGNLQVTEQPGIIRSIADLPGASIHVSAVDLIGTTIDPKELWNLSGLVDLRELLLPGPIFNPGAGSRLDANDELAPLANLRKLEKLWFSLHFLTNINVQDKGLAYLKYADQLRELRVAQSKVKGPSLAAFKQLAALDLSDTPFGDDGAAYLSGLTQLRRLTLRNTTITDATLKSIAGLQNLESLDLYGTRVTDAGVRLLSGLTRLRDLNVLGTSITDEGAGALAELRNLENLNLYRTPMTNVGLAKLQKLKTLTALDVRYTRITTSGVEAFRGAVPGCRIEFEDATAAGSSEVSLRQSKPSSKSEQAIAAWITKVGGLVVWRNGHLVEINLARTPVSDKQVAYLADLPAVEKLSLAGTQIGDAALVALGKLPAMQDLDLSGAIVSDEGLVPLSGLRQLKTLRLNNTPVTGQGLAALGVLPIQSLEVSGAAVNDAGLRAIAGLPSLHQLRLNSTDISDAGVAALAPARQLQSLELNSTDIGDGALKTLGELPELRDLQLSYSRITNAGLPSLAKLQHLESLSVAHTRLTDEAAGTLAQLPQLKRLNLDYTTVSDKGLKIIQAALPNLEELRLDSTGLTDAGTDILRTMTHLRILNLYHTLVTEKAYEALKQSLPQCHIIFDRDSSLPNRRHS